MGDTDYSHINPLPGYLKESIKGSLAHAFGSKDIVESVEVDWQGRVEIKSQNWDQYWDFDKNLLKVLKDCFSSFEKARFLYFDSGFNSDYIKEYSYRYFVLLSEVLKSSKLSVISSFLNKLLALENFSIKWYGKKTGIAAGTTSHRNPAYLLAGLGKQSFKEDPKYLPLIMLENCPGNQLFYHYRQYRISKNPSFSVFVYPAESFDYRAESFTLIETFVNGFSSKSDPRSKERGGLLARCAVYPFLKSLTDKDNGEQRSIKIVDLGGGSGILVRHIWEHVLKEYHVAKANWFLNCSIVGLRVQNPARHFSKGVITENMEYMDYQQLDYIDWLNKQTKPFEYDIALMCRLLNNISFFDIEGSEDEALLWYISGKQVNPEVIVKQGYNPVCCLRQEEYHPENLIHTNGKTRLSDDHIAYRTLSLADYYKAIAFSMDRDIVGNKVYYPVRKFNASALLDSEDESILGKLSRNTKLTVIEDVDLTANYLAKHVQNHKLNCAVSAINIAPRYSSQVLAVCDKKYEEILPGAKIC